jgi:predicted nucleic acid-binding protein
VILVDSSVWIEHLRTPNKRLHDLLEGNEVLAHPLVIGELALGHISRRHVFLTTMALMPRAPVATDKEVLRFVEQHRLFGRGIGYIDAHLLASLALSADAALWTRDKPLQAAADRLGLAVGFR